MACDGEGTCVCPSGFTGPDCGNAWNEVYLGTHQATEFCTDGENYTYTVTVVENSSDPDKITIQDFAGVSNLNVSFTLSDQGSVSTNTTIQGCTITGSGILNAAGTKLKIDYHIVGGTIDYKCCAEISL